MTAKKTDKTDDRDDGVTTVKAADGRVHYTAKGSAAERDLTAKADKSKNSSDATPAVTEG